MPENALKVVSSLPLPVRRLSLPHTLSARLTDTDEDRK